MNELGGSVTAMIGTRQGKMEIARVALFPGGFPY